MNPTLLIAIPLLGAFIAVFLKKWAKGILSVVVIFNIVYASIGAVMYENPVVYMIGGFKPPFGISLVLDSYSLVGLLVLNAVFALIILLSFKLIRQYAAVLAVSLAALNGLILTGDLFNLFVFLEIAAIAAYITTTMNKGFKHTLNYLILGTLASGLYLFGIIILYNIFGSLNIAHIAQTIQTTANFPVSVLALPLVMIFVGLSVEVKLLPFSGWVRGILKGANSLVGALIASAYATAILFVFGRLINTIFVMSQPLTIAFTVIAVATLVLAEFSAFSKRNIREILLFSSIAQSGLVVLLMLYGYTLPAILVLVNNVVSKVVLFSLAGKIADETGTDHIYELKGIFAKYKLIGIGFTVAAMSLIGLPLFFGFVSKINVLMTLFDNNIIWLPIVILLVSVVEGAYIMRILTNLWNTGEEGQMAKLADVKDYKLDGYKKVGIVVVIVAIAIVVFGILPLTDIKEFFNIGFLANLTQSLGGV